MRKIAKCGITALFSLLIFSGISVFSWQAFAQSSEAGVSEGDVFVYDISATWNSTDPTVPMPEEYNGLKNHEWVRLKVTKVEQPIVYSEFTMHYKNGTEEIDQDARRLFYITEKPNLSANETAAWFNIYQGTNETILRSYSGVERETNRVREYLLVGGREIFPALLEVYVDKETGVLVEYRHEVPVTVHEYEEGKYDVSWLNILLTLREPPAWSIKESGFPLLLAAPFAIIPAITAVMIAVRKTRKQTPKTIEIERNKKAIGEYSK